MGDEYLAELLQREMYEEMLASLEPPPSVPGVGMRSAVVLLERLETTVGIMVEKQRLRIQAEADVKRQPPPSSAASPGDDTSSPGE